MVYAAEIAALEKQLGEMTKGKGNEGKKYP